MNQAVSTSRELEAPGIGSGSPSASQPFPQIPGRFYRPELDVVRFLAFFLVYLYHSLPHFPSVTTASLPMQVALVLCTFVQASGFGLSLFFTLSAYLICELLLRERAATGAVQAKQFYIRRILRIWPLYFAGLTIGLAYAYLVGGDPSAVSWAAWSAILLGNWWVTLHGFAGGPMGVLWSISVEEQFYLFAPWAIKCFSRWSLRAFGLVLIVTANAWLFFLGRVRVPELAIWTNSFVQFENFAAGLLLCLALRDRSIRIPVWTRFLLLATCATFWYYACKGFNVHYPGNVGPGSWQLIGGYGLAALGCCCLIVAFLGLDRKVLPRWTIYLGRISYGLYVFHLLSNQIVGSVFPHHSSFGGITMIIKGTCGLGLTILLASLSYRYFETPFLRMKKRHEVIESRPI